jgi:hypothetical protein
VEGALAGAGLPIGGSICCADAAAESATTVARAAIANLVLNMMLTGGKALTIRIRGYR